MTVSEFMQTNSLRQSVIGAIAGILLLFGAVALGFHAVQAVMPLNANLAWACVLAVSASTALVLGIACLWEFGRQSIHLAQLARWLRKAAKAKTLIIIGGGDPDFVDMRYVDPAGQTHTRKAFAREVKSFTTTARVLPRITAA